MNGQERAAMREAERWALWAEHELNEATKYKDWSDHRLSIGDRSTALYNMERYEEHLRNYRFNMEQLAGLMFDQGDECCE